MMAFEPSTPPPPPPPLREEMATLAVADDHPLSAVPADADPLLSPTPSSSFLDPLAYSDVVFSPVDSSPNGAASLSPFSGEPSNRSDPLFLPAYTKITVSNPQKEQNPSGNSLVPGSGSFITYLITSCSADPPAGESAEISVRRRFRDVVTVADGLAKAYRGFFIPPRPYKSVVESQVMQKQEFVEQRRSELEKYLWRLTCHPVIGRSQELRAFLRAEGRMPLLPSTDVASRMLDGVVRLPKQLLGEPRGCLAPQEAVKPAKGGRNLLRVFKELRQSMANDWVGVKPLLVEEDKEFLDRKDKMHDLEQQLSTASREAEALVKSQQDFGETMGELGLAFIKLAKFETEASIYDSQRSWAADAKCVATAAVKASRVYRDLNARTVKQLDTLHEYLGLMTAVHSAFSERSSALLTVQTLMSDLSSFNTRVERLEAASSRSFGADRSRSCRIEELKETIRVTEDAKSCAFREYESIKENNRNELERLDKERHEDFLGMLKGFVIDQAGYSEKIANVWAKVAEETSRYVTDRDN